MKVLLYTEGLKTVGKSGLGKAIKHQMKALDYAKIPYTLDPHDDYDILHINTYSFILLVFLYLNFIQSIVFYAFLLFTLFTMNIFILFCCKLCRYLLL